MSEEKRPQEVHLSERSRLAVTGVREVKSFEETAVSCVTELGALTVRGKDLRVTVYAVETGDLVVEGRVDALAFSTDSHREGLFSRLMR